MWVQSEPFRELKEQVGKLLDKCGVLELRVERKLAAADVEQTHTARDIAELRARAELIPDLLRRIEVAEREAAIHKAAIQTLSTRFNNMNQYIMQLDPRGSGDEGKFQTPPKPFEDELARAQRVAEEEQLGEQDASQD